MGAVLHGVSSAFEARHVCDSAPGKGHDRLLVEDHCVGVADGATPLAGHWPQDVGDFAAAALAALARGAADPAAEMVDVWRRAIREVDLAVDGEEPYRSCGVAFVRARGAVLEIAALGDCGVLLRGAHGVTRLQDERLTRLDAEVRGAGPHQAGARLLANRHRMNTPDGYWIFARDTRAAEHLVLHTVPASEVQQLLLYTDGYYRLVEPYHVYRSPEHLLEEAAADVEASLAALRRHEARAREGPGLLERPDDATAVVLCAVTP